VGLGFLNKKEDGQDEEDVIEEDFVELDAQTSSEGQKVVVRAETLKEFDDIEGVQEKLRNDMIIWVNIKPLKQKDMTKLKRAIKRLKKTVKSVEGDIAGVDEDWIVVTPSYAEIERNENVESK
jgi:SepF-like predicted cell division protein (DUF552 family)